MLVSELYASGTQRKHLHSTAGGHVYVYKTRADVEVVPGTTSSDGKKANYERNEGAKRVREIDTYTTITEICCEDGYTLFSMTLHNVSTTSYPLTEASEEEDAVLADSLEEYETYFTKWTSGGEIESVDFDPAESTDSMELKRSFISAFFAVSKDLEYGYRKSSKISTDGHAIFRRHCVRMLGSETFRSDDEYVRRIHEEESGHMTNEIVRSRCEKEFLSYPDNDRVKNRTARSEIDTLAPEGVLLKSENVERFVLESKVDASYASLANMEQTESYRNFAYEGDEDEPNRHFLIKTTADVAVRLSIELVRTTDENVIAIYDRDFEESAFSVEPVRDGDEWYPPTLAWSLDVSESRRRKSQDLHRSVVRKRCPAFSSQPANNEEYNDDNEEKDAINTVFLEHAMTRHRRHQKHRRGRKKHEHATVARRHKEKAREGRVNEVGDVTSSTLNCQDKNLPPAAMAMIRARYECLKALDLSACATDIDSKTHLRQLFERAIDEASADDATLALRHLLNAQKCKSSPPTYFLTFEEGEGAPNIEPVSATPEDSKKAVAAFIFSAFQKNEIEEIEQRCTSVEGCTIVPWDASSSLGGTCVDPCEYAVATLSSGRDGVSKSPPAASAVNKACQGSGVPYCAYGQEATKLTKTSDPDKAICVVRCKYIGDESTCKSATSGKGCRWKSGRFGRPGQCEAVTQTQTGMLMQVLQNLKSIILKAANKAKVVKNLEENAKDVGDDATHADETTGEKTSQFSSLVIKMVDKILERVMSVDLTGLIRFLHNAVVFNKRLVSGEAGLLSLVKARGKMKDIEKGCQKSEIDSSTCPYLKSHDIRRHRLLFAKKKDALSEEVPQCFIWDKRAYECASTASSDDETAGSANSASSFQLEDGDNQDSCQERADCVWRGNAGTASAAFPECAPKDCTTENAFCVSGSGENYHATSCVRHPDSGKMEPMPGLATYPSSILKYSDWCDSRRCGNAPEDGCGVEDFSHCELDESNRCLDKCERAEDGSDAFLCDQMIGCRWLKGSGGNEKGNTNVNEGGICVSTPTRVRSASPDASSTGGSASSVSFLAIFTDLPPWDKSDSVSSKQDERNFPPNCEVSHVVRNVQRAGGVGVIFVIDTSEKRTPAEKQGKLKSQSRRIDVNTFIPGFPRFGSVPVALEDPLEIPVVFASSPLPGMSGTGDVSGTEPGASRDTHAPISLALSSPRGINADKCYDLCVRRKKAFSGITGHFMDFVTLISDLIEASAHLYSSMSVGLVAAGTELMNTLYQDHLEQFGLFSSVHNRTLGDPQKLAVTLRTQFDLSMSLDPLNALRVQQGAEESNEGSLQKCIDLIDSHMSSSSSISPGQCSETVANQCKSTCFGDGATSKALMTEAEANEAKREKKAKFIQRLKQSSFTGQMQIALDFSALGGSYTAVSLQFRPTLHGTNGWAVPVPAMTLLGVEVPINLEGFEMIKNSMQKMGMNFIASGFRNKQLQHALTRKIVFMLRDPQTIYGRWLGAPERWLGGLEDFEGKSSFVSLAPCATFETREMCDVVVDEDGDSRCTWKPRNVDRHCIAAKCAGKKNSNCAGDVSQPPADNVFCTLARVKAFAQDTEWDGNTLSSGEYVVVKTSPSEAPSAVEQELFQVIAPHGAKGTYSLTSTSKTGTGLVEYNVRTLTRVTIVDEQQCVAGVPEISMKTATLADATSPLIRFLDALYDAFDTSGFDISDALREVEVSGNCMVASPIEHALCRLSRALRGRMTNRALHVETEASRIPLADLIRFVRIQLATAVENLASRSAGGAPVSIFGPAGKDVDRLEEEILREEIEQEEESSKMNLESSNFAGNSAGAEALQSAAEMRLYTEQLVIRTSQRVDRMLARDRACSGLRQFCRSRDDMEACKNVQIHAPSGGNPLPPCQWRPGANTCDLGPRYRGITSTWVTSMTSSERQKNAELLGEVSRVSFEDADDDENAIDALKRRAAVDFLV
eukprot:g4522.t1